MVLLLRTEKYKKIMTRYKFLVLPIPDWFGCSLKQEINTHKSADAAIELFDAKFTAQGQAALSP